MSQLDAARIADEIKAGHSLPVGASESGEPIYECHWTGKPVLEHEVIWTGPVMPNVKFKHAAAPGYEAARKQSARNFNDMDANCNTCKHLQRVPHEKRGGGILYGRCTNPNADMSAHPYAKTAQDGVFAFAPEDWMGMPCHEQRPERA